MSLSQITLDGFQIILMYRRSRETSVFIYGLISKLIFLMFFIASANSFCRGLSLRPGFLISINTSSSPLKAIRSQTEEM